MKPAECKLHKNLSTIWDHGVAAFRKLFRELKYLLCTVTFSLLWTIFCEFYYDCRLWMSLLWSLPSSLVNQVYFSISVPQSILLELQWLFPEIICSKHVQMLRLEGDRHGNTGKHGIENLLQRRDRQCSRLTMDVCTHTAYPPAHSRYFGETPTSLQQYSFVKEGGQALIATWGFHMVASHDWLLMITMLSNLLAPLQDESWCAQRKYKEQMEEIGFAKNIPSMLVSISPSP